jgi:very-short-patch-repair endonuclease
VLASLQAALKTAIQIVFQLEEQEIAAEPLPSNRDRQAILLYESAEGGAGVLRQLLEPGQLRRLAKKALEVCHFDPDTGEDRYRGNRAQEDCEAACYECLMNYSNQRDHDLLDRQSIHSVLLRLRDASVAASPTPTNRSSHLESLLAQCGSELERKWLRWLDSNDFKLPTHAQYSLTASGTRPDFAYASDHALIYIDGPPHDFTDRQHRDRLQTAQLEDEGYSVIRFHHEADWSAVVAQWPNIFGKVQA